MIVRGGRQMISDELFLESGLKQAFADTSMFSAKHRRNGYISVERRQRWIGEFTRSPIQPVQTMRPATNRNYLGQPRFERLDKTHKWFCPEIFVHDSSSRPRAGARTLLQISSACSFPREG